MSDIVERLRGTTRAMAVWCSVDMGLWDDHSIACLEAATEIERLRTLNAEMVWALLEARTDLMIAANNADDAAKTDRRWDGVSSRLRERNHQIDAVLAKAEGGSDG